MTDDEPDRPELPECLLDAVDQQDADALRALADYALERAEWSDHDLDDDQDPERDVPDIYDRDDVLDQINEAPPRASLTTKTIDGRSYYYYQWRDGDKVKSEYIGPVDPA